jgi:hypothetical protein
VDDKQFIESFDWKLYCKITTSGIEEEIQDLRNSFISLTEHLTPSEQPAAQDPDHWRLFYWRYWTIYRFGIPGFHVLGLYRIGYMEPYELRHYCIWKEAIVTYIQVSQASEAIKL